jgi:hypothetical protein
MSNQGIPGVEKKLDLADWDETRVLAHRMVMRLFQLNRVRLRMV